MRTVTAFLHADGYLVLANYISLCHVPMLKGHLKTLALRRGLGCTFGCAGVFDVLFASGKVSTQFSCCVALLLSPICW